MQTIRISRLRKNEPN